jgi:phosphoglycolate phosphatase
MAVQLILWDFDGSLADTLSGLLTIYNDLAVHYGFRPVTDPLAARNLTALQLLRACNVPLWRVPFVLRRILALQSSRMAHVRLFPDVEPVLRELHQSQRRLAVLSSNTRTNILTCLRANQVDGLFESVDGYPRLFGKARGIHRVLTARGVGASEVLYVGDEVRDIDAARQAGVAIAAVTWGLNSPELLARHQPDYLIERPDQLYEVLD